jgi:hypothetical protein
MGEYLKRRRENVEWSHLALNRVERQAVVVPICHYYPTSRFDGDFQQPR